MQFSALSEAIVLFSVPAAFWHMLVIQIAAGVSIRQRIIVGAIMLAWTAFAYANIRYGVGDQFFPLPIIKPVLSLALACFVTWLFRNILLGHGVPQQYLIALQLFRPIGMIFVLESSRGQLPWTFAWPAGWGDLVAGLTALIVLLRYPSGPVPRNAVLLVAIVGILDFTSAFFFGFTSSKSPLQLFAFDNPNQVLDYALGLIPMFLVPYAMMAHILSLAQLAKDKNK
jgi:hypothetical protein